ncbi:MAG: class I SAM-dependent methyltransferase [Vicinamibacterales bacterium]
MSVVESFKRRAFNVAFFGVVRRLPLGLANRMVSGLYDLVNAGVGQTSSQFTNYGYAAARGQVDPDGVVDDRRYDYLSRQLYERLVGPTSLKGKDVLEVGCGRGGGASYISEHFGPTTMTGVDLSEKAIKCCRRRYRRPGLQFVRGAAESLPFPDGCFDVVINVESSHTYPSMPTFLGEVTRVLRPDGLFLIADFRRRVEMPTLRAHFAAAGLTVRRHDNITANVVFALDLTSATKIEMTPKPIPKRRRLFLENFAAVQGSEMYRSFVCGELEYWCFVVDRRASSGADTA